MSKQETFNTLLALSQRYVSSAQGLPAQVDAAPTKAVVCFSLLGTNLAVALDEVAELLGMPPTTRLPRVKSWIKGVSNVRGRLLPVIDFASFLGGAINTPPKQQRVIVIEIMDIFVGLAVDRVYAMRHFRLDSYSQSDQAAPVALHPYLEGSFRYGDEDWYLFRPTRLIQDSQFMAVAA